MPQRSYAKLMLGQALGRDVDEWLREQVAAGLDDVQITVECRRLMGADISVYAVRRWIAAVAEPAAS